MAGLRPPEPDVGAPRSPHKSAFALLGCFCLIVLMFALFERTGIELERVPEAVIASAFALFVLVALVAHGRRPADYYVAGRRLAPEIGGLAMATSFAGIMLIGLAGGIYGSAAEIVTSAGGLLLGLVLLAIFVAPPLNRFAGYSVGDFMAARFGGAAPRLVWALVAFSSSLLLLAALLKTLLPVVENLFGLSPAAALYLVAALTASVPMSGGLRSLSWTQVIQYFVIVLACLLPVAFLSAGDGGAAIGVAVKGVGPLLADLGRPLDASQAAGVALQALLLAAGFASLPYLPAQVLAAPSGREAVASLIWALLLGVLLVAAGIIFGRALAEQTGLVASFGIPGDLLALTIPLLAALPSILAGLVVAGALAGLLAAGQAALLAAAAALSHDVVGEILDRRGPAGRRLVTARLSLVLVAVLAASVVGAVDIDAPNMLGWAMALAAAGIMAPLVLGLWWGRCGALGGTLGMLAGFGVALAVLLHDVLAPALADRGAFGSIAGATLGMAAALLVAIVLSLITEPPSSEIQALVARLHRPGALKVRERPA